MEPREALSLKDVLNPKPPSTIETVTPPGPIDLEEVSVQERLASESILFSQMTLRPPSRESAPTASWGSAIFIAVAIIAFVIVSLLIK